MTIVAGDVVKTVVRFILGDGTQYQNVYYHQRIGSTVLSDAVQQTAIEEWVDAIYLHLVANISDAVVATLSFIDRIEWDGTKWEVVQNIGTFTPDVTPSAGGDEMPNQMSPYVVFKTPRPQTTGKKYLFPMMEGSYTNGILTAAIVLLIADYAADVLANISLEDPDYLVPGVPRTAVDSWQPFNATVVGNIAGTQRRRRRGVGA